ncbi:hypothetical protein [Pleionea sp. CnH1-48]|uniref:hypothetical protein n=1 Tax=Pleionea sp. CnH1-48 TaxID=2954494 RepID=UPI0020982D99|nr:hypothetical protein [Pleionea sp. CnH1-48]MCO7223220.1 hypothetical protein [Pleionea sp. CnH1-48]
MQFITNGPDIPDVLLQAHEEGRIVFFCGAGISYPAGLPGFKGLVEQIYSECGTSISDIEKEAFERGQFDATLDLLERRLPGQRLSVRRALAKVSQPKLRRKGAFDTQAALLRLARSREGALRMVTTNFDRIFHTAAKRSKQTFKTYSAPMLPMLPIFSWENPVEASAVWKGFLWSPRLYQPLLTAIKTYLLECADHYIELGEHRQQFAIFLTYTALGPTEEYTVDELRSAIDALPQDGLEHCARALTQALEGAADQREEYWRNRCQPFWQNIWPKSRDLATPQIAESLARLVIASRKEFPKALALVSDWLEPLEHQDYAVHLLKESGLSSLFPEEALQLLSVLIVEQQWAPSELGRCLEEISQAKPDLTQDNRYQKLNTYFQTRGI